MTYFTHTCQLCVPTIVEVSLKGFFFCYTRQSSGWKSRRPQNDVYLAFVLNAIIYSSSTLHIYNWLHDVFNPLHSNIRMHILQTVLYIFPYVLARRICLTIKRFFSWLSFPLFSWPQCVTQGWYWIEKLDASHSQGLKCC